MGDMDGYASGLERHAAATRPFFFAHPIKPYGPSFPAAMTFTNVGFDLDNVSKEESESEYRPSPV